MAFNPAEPRDTAGKWYHGTHLAGLKPGDPIEPGHQKNWGYSDPQHISISSNPHGALGYGDVSAFEHGRGRRAGHVYEVAPTGPVEQDKNSIGRGDEKENRQTTGARVIRELSPAEALTIRWQQQGWGDPPAELLKKAGPVRETDLSTQIEMAFDPAEPRDKQGKWSVWYHGTTAEKARAIQREGLRSNRTTDDRPYMTLASHADEAGMWAGAHGAVVEIHIPDDQRSEFIDAPPGNLGFMGPARLSGIRKYIPPSMVHKIIYIDPRQAELSGTCDHCGCPRPDSITDQIELAWHFDPAERRDAHGRWTGGAVPSASGRSAIEDERISDAIVKEWRKTEKPGAIAIELNRASAALDASDHEGALQHLREAARLADEAGHPDDAARYRRTADRIQAADEAHKDLESPVARMADRAMPAVDRMVGGHSAWNGAIRSWDDDDPEHIGIAAEMRWDGTMGVRAELAREIKRTQDDPKTPVNDPVQYQDLLHELIHSELSSPNDKYASHASAYQKPDVRAIEEGFTELGAHHHAHEFFDVIGIGNRPTQITAQDEYGDPVPNPAYRRAVSKLAANLQAGYVKLSADPRPPQRHAAELLGNLVEEIKADPESLADGNFIYAIASVQHLGDPQMAKWAMAMTGKAQQAQNLGLLKHATMGELADKYNSGLLIDSGSGWGHYPLQTMAAQRWVQDVAKAEGIADTRSGTPGHGRTVALADEINREGAADKDYAMASQLLRARGIDPRADTSLTQVVAGFIRNHWAEHMGDGAANYQAAVSFLRMIQAPSPHKMAELSEAL